MKSKVVSVTLKVLLGLAVAFVAFLVGMLIFDRIAQANELKLLKEKGYVNPVSVGEYSLNVIVYGSETPKHTIVGMSGMGMDDFSCTIRYVTDAVAGDNRVVLIDRAGYGLSDDTSVPQTLERIISDYRTALQNAGIEGPYVLLPHSIAGPYAAYWASQYPDEIEGIFILDGTPINGEEYDLLSDVGFFDALSVAGSRLGLARIYIPLFVSELLKLPKEEDVETAMALFHHNGAFGRAKYSEADLERENMRAAWDGIKQTDIPKVYLSASVGAETFEEYLEYVNYFSDFYNMDIVGSSDEEKLRESFEETIQFRHDYVDVLCERMGNCEIVLLPGDHIIYCHKPDEVAKHLQEFLENRE